MFFDRGIFLILILIIGFVLLAILSSRAMRRVLGPVILLLLLGGIVVLFTAPSIQKRVIAQTQLIDATTNIAVDVDSWSLGAAVPFEADIYPSIQAAAKALTRKFCREFDTGEIDDKTIFVTGELGNDFLATAAEIIRTEIEGIPVVVSSLPDRPDATEAVIIRFTSTSSYCKSGPAGSTNGGTIQLSVDSSQRQMVYSADYVEKGWADDFAAFVNQQPEHVWILAMSPTPATNEFEARELAYQDAGQKLVAMINHTTQPTISIQQIQHELDRLNLIADRFVQKFSRPYGDIWRCALLIDASPDKIKSLTHQHSVYVHSRRKSVLAHILSMAALFAVISGVYLFVNAATRGYYTWSLRIAGVILAVLAAVLVLVHFRFI